MSLTWWFPLGKRKAQPSRRPRIPSFIPRLEVLEDRTVPAPVIVNPGGSIQTAVNAANPGDTVLINPGTYTEQVTINKNLTLQGNGAGAIIQAPNPLTPDAFGLNVLVEVNTAATVNINNLTIQGPSPSINVGILVVGGATANVTGATITQIQDPATFGNQTGFGIQVGGTGSQAVGQVGHATITDCTVTDYQKVGIIIGRNGSSGTITGTTITGVGPTPQIAQNGIQISPGTATATVSNNTISGNQFTGMTSSPDPFTSDQSTGILNFIDTSNITGNMVFGNDLGIFSANSGSSSTGTMISGNIVQGNRFEGILLAQGTATVSNNTITGNNIGVAVIATVLDQFGNPTTTNAVGTLLSNNITNNGNGGVAFPGGGIRLLVQAGATTTAQATAHFNRIVGNSVGLDNTTTALVDATNNFWGSNTGPGGPGSDTVKGLVNFNPWLVLLVTATPTTIQPGGVATVVADLTKNSSGMDTSALGHVPDGIPVSFATTSGSIVPITSTTTAGKATAQFTAGNTAGPATVSAKVDNQTSTATLTTIPAPPTPPACMIPPFAVTPNQKFVAQVYCDLFERTVDPVGLSYWNGFLSGGTSRSQVVFDIEFALPNEYQTIVVQSLYHQYLHRAADPLGLQNGIAFLNGGGTNEQLATLLIASPEFFMLAGGTNAGFLNALYLDALGRPIDPTAAANLGAFLAQGGSRAVVASGVLHSLEYQTKLVEGYYEEFLRRPADPIGLALYVNLLQQGKTDQQVIASIVGSPEYFAGVQSGSFQQT